MTKVEPKNRISKNGDGATAAPAEKPASREIQITPAKMETIRLLLIGTSPLVQNRFGEKARNIIIATQEAGSQAKKGKKREPKDFDQCYEQARHLSPEGWDGIHAGGFRRAMVDACKLVGFFMTKAKLGLFVVADGYSVDGSPLTKITKGEPRKVIHPARNASGGADLRARPMWDAGWECILTVRYDADMFSATDVVNLVARVGMQCGIGEGRPNSRIRQDAIGDCSGLKQHQNETDRTATDRKRKHRTGLPRQYRTVAAWCRSEGHGRDWLGSHRQGLERQEWSVAVRQLPDGIGTEGQDSKGAESIGSNRYGKERQEGIGYDRTGTNTTGVK